MVSIPRNVPSHIVLFDVPWDAYAGMIEAFGDKRMPHVYQHGTLEIHSICKQHELIRLALGRFVEFGSLELGMHIRSVGSATRQNQKLEHGIEPYASYYIGRNAINGRNRTAKARRESVPDLVIDIEWSRFLLPKLKTYAALGVREAWIYHQGKVKFHALSNNAEYETVRKSVAFPLMSSKQISYFTGRICKVRQNDLTHEFLTYLQNKQKLSLAKKSNE